MFLIRKLTTHCHLIKESCDFMGGGYLLQTITLLSFSSNNPPRSKYITRFIYHVTSRNPVIKKVCGFVVGCS